MRHLYKTITINKRSSFLFFTVFPVSLCCGYFEYKVFLTLPELINSLRAYGNVPFPSLVVRSFILSVVLTAVSRQFLLWYLPYIESDLIKNLRRSFTNSLLMQPLSNFYRNTEKEIVDILSHQLTLTGLAYRQFLTLISSFTISTFLVFACFNISTLLTLLITAILLIYYLVVYLLIGRLLKRVSHVNSTSTQSMIYNSQILFRDRRHLFFNNQLLKLLKRSFASSFSNHAFASHYSPFLSSSPRYLLEFFVYFLFGLYAFRYCMALMPMIFFMVPRLILCYWPLLHKNFYLYFNPYL